MWDRSRTYLVRYIWSTSDSVMLPSKKNVNVTGRIIARVESLSNPLGKIPYHRNSVHPCAATASWCRRTRFQDALNICQPPTGKDFYHPGTWSNQVLP